MTLVDVIDLEHDELYVKVDVIDLSSDEDSVKKDGNAEEEDDDDNVPQSGNLAEAATSLPISEQVAAATESLSMVDHGSAISPLMAEKSMHPENQDLLAKSDVAKEATQPGNCELIAAGVCVGEAMQSEREASMFLSMTEQDATSLLLTKQCAITSLLKEDKFVQSGNQVFVTAVYCAEEHTQSENRANAVGLASMTERGATCKIHRVEQLRQMIGCPHIIGDGFDLCSSHGGGHPHDEPGSSTVPCTKSEVSSKRAQEEPKGDTDKDENSDFEAETETFSHQEKEKETGPFRKFYVGKEKKQVNISATERNRQLDIHHTKGVPQTLHNGDSGSSVIRNGCNGTSSIGINILDGEVVMSTYQECNKTFHGNTMNDKVRDSDSKGCMVQGCTNGAHGGTPLCIFHHSRPHEMCCAVTGCTKKACKGSQGRTDRCVKHGGGKRCKYDGCGKGAQGTTDYCIAHGGGRRCKFQGCRKSAQGRCDYCIRHGGGKRCKFLGCSASATCGTDFCYMHRKSLPTGNNPDHEMLPAPAHQAKKAQSSRKRNSHSGIGGRSQKRPNTNDYVNTVVEV
jgi:hypothetical protein